MGSFDGRESDSTKQKKYYGEGQILIWTLDLDGKKEERGRKAPGRAPAI